MLCRCIVPALAVCLLAGCATPARGPAAPAFDPTAAPILLYAVPVPSEAHRLSARLAVISAVREDGGIVPLRLVDPEVVSDVASPQRLVAMGALPEGRYTGLEVTAAEATVEDPENPASLSLPEGPTRVDLIFTAVEGRGLVVDWELDLKAAQVDGFRFVPAFRASIPVRPLAGLVGMASLPDAGLVLTFDRRSGRVAGATPVGRWPRGIAIDGIRRRAYVAVAGDDALVAIDLEQGVVQLRRPMRAGDQPVDVALTPDGLMLLVANEGSSSVSFVDPMGLSEGGRTDVGESPAAVLIDRQGQRAFVPCRRANQVVVLSVPGRTSVGSIATDPDPFRVALSRTARRLYVAHEGSPHVVVADPGSLAVLQRFFVGPGQTAISVDATSDRIFLARRGTGALEVFDPLSLLAIDHLSVVGTVAYMTFDRETASILVALPQAGRIDRVSPVSRSIEGVITTGPGVQFVAVPGER